MSYTPQRYNFTDSDREAIEKFGYQFHATGTLSIVDFMEKYFPEFNLLALLKIVENNFSPTTTAPIYRRIDFDSTIGLFRITYTNNEKNEDNALLFIRTFTSLNKDIQVSHDYCVIPQNSRGQGIIKPVFRESLQQYINMGASKIHVHAGLSGGGYTWAKHGFVAINRQEVDVILSYAQSHLTTEEFEDIKIVYDNYYSHFPNGTEFPIDVWAAIDFMRNILMGSDWHGELNLKNHEQLRNFIEYVSR